MKTTLKALILVTFILTTISCAKKIPAPSQLANWAPNQNETPGWNLIVNQEIAAKSNPQYQEQLTKIFPGLALPEKTLTFIAKTTDESEKEEGNVSIIGAISFYNSISDAKKAMSFLKKTTEMAKTFYKEGDYSAEKLSLNLGDDSYTAYTKGSFPQAEKKAYSFESEMTNFRIKNVICSITANRKDWSRVPAGDQKEQFHQAVKKFADLLNKKIK